MTKVISTRTIDPIECAALFEQRDRRWAADTRSAWARWTGDPEPGRSALDQKQREQPKGFSISAAQNKARVFGFTSSAVGSLSRYG
jgi:hypothetical protein